MVYKRLTLYAQKSTLVVDRTTPFGAGSLFMFWTLIWCPWLGLLDVVLLELWIRYSTTGGCACTQVRAVSAGLLQRFLRDAVSMTLDPTAGAEFSCVCTCAPTSNNNGTIPLAPLKDTDKKINIFDLALFISSLTSIVLRMCVHTIIYIIIHIYLLSLVLVLLFD